MRKKKIVSFLRDILCSGNPKQFIFKYAFTLALIEKLYTVLNQNGVQIYFNLHLVYTPTYQINTGAFVLNPWQYFHTDKFKKFHLIYGFNDAFCQTDWIKLEFLFKMQGPNVLPVCKIQSCYTIIKCTLLVWVGD